MTATVDSPGHTLPQLRERSAWWVANVWLLFLLFPLATVIGSDLAIGRKVASYVLIALFAVIYAGSNRLLIRRELGLGPTGRRVGPISLDSSVPWLIALVAVAAAASVVGGWALFGVTPFIVSFAMFHFDWRIAVSVAVATLLVVIGTPLLAGRLGDLWFFGVIVVSVAVSCVLFRLSEEHAIDRKAMETQLAISGERERVARDVHDVLGHSLTAVILKTQVVSRMIDRDAALDADGLAAVREQVGEIDVISRRALAEIRATVGGLRSADLGDELGAARAVLADAGVVLTVEGSAAAAPETFRPVLGWVVRESVTNIVRHSRATTCNIEVGGQPILRIADDGLGTGDADEGNGLTGLRERLADAGLALELGPGLNGRGTSVTVVDQGVAAT